MVDNTGEEIVIFTYSPYNPISWSYYPFPPTCQKCHRFMMFVC